MYTFKTFYIPEHMMESIRRYVDHGIKPGSFLEAVICNNLYKAIAHADSVNIHQLPAYAAYFYNETPFFCWGSRERMVEWMARFKGD